ncbi:TetR/AcrR family transcriptional regulator [Goekera deserti]|uniref:TetR/AcrR family transcriptional regulator n=1 Tax=Goekera deserti TaxID=2497753 RepID=A0A7K3WDH2_9ACTN|nr:TetR/AcrR family transcriptional regulator [Goekera deserti]NDI48071.1 TetR family transcriptional regulator [Goekera deserti]NEL53820.1 TetR/AcrR family transcriptional regulator [Goekera deserti]
MTRSQPRPAERPGTAPGPPVPRAGTGARRGPSEQTRRRVFLAVGALVERLDHRSVTVDAVARASGVGRSTIYRHWPSRQVLVLEAYSWTTNRVTPLPDTGDVVEDLRVYLSELAFCTSFGGAAPTVAGLLVDALEDAEFAVAFRRVLVGERRRAFATILARGQQRGQVRPDLDRDAAVDALYGALHHRLLMSGQPVDGPFVAALVDVVTRGLVARPADDGSAAAARTRERPRSAD